jgi:hypothetical protein
MTEIEKMELLKKIGWTYKSDTGEFFNKWGKKSKTIDCYGYQVINTKFNKQKIQVKAHRYAWFFVYGEVPDNILDHIDRDRSNNKISNLRISNTQLNGFNRDDKGFHYNKNEKKFKSQIMIDGKSIHLGYFLTADEARETYLKAKEKYHKIK